MSEEKEISEAFQKEISGYRPKKKKRRVWRDEDEDTSLSKVELKEERFIEKETVSISPPVETKQEVNVETVATLNTPETVVKEAVSEKVSDKEAKGKYYALYNYNEKIESLKSGFTMLPNSMLLEMLEKRVSPGGMRALLLIVRLSIGYQKDRAYISKSIFSEFMPTMSKSKLNKELRLLEEKGFITIQQGDRTSTSCFIVDPKYHNKSLNGLNKKKDSSPKTNNKQESRKDKSTSLGVLIDLNLSPGKIDDEKKSITKLKERYSDQEIIDAHKYIVTFGALKSEEKVRAPFTYLRKAIDDVLVNVEKQKLKEKHVNARKEAHKNKLHFDEQIKEKAENRRRRKENIEERISEKFKKSFTEAELVSKIDSTIEALFKKFDFMRSIPVNMLNQSARFELALKEGFISQEEYSFLKN